MKATEFVKYLKNGIESAKELMEVRPYMLEEMGIDLSDLQNLVNAYELVEKAGGIDNAKGICSVENTHYLGCKLPNCDDLKQAIELVESVNE